MSAFQEILNAYTVKHEEVLRARDEIKGLDWAIEKLVDSGAHVLSFAKGVFNDHCRESESLPDDCGTLGYLSAVGREMGLLRAERESLKVLMEERLQRINKALHPSDNHSPSAGAVAMVQYWLKQDAGECKASKTARVRGHA